MSDEVDLFVEDLLQPTLDPDDGFYEGVLKRIVWRANMRRIALSAAVASGLMVSLSIIYLSFPLSEDWMTALTFTIKEFSLVDTVSWVTGIWFVAAMVMPLILTSLLFDTDIV
ncbi:MAG: hypothetical protein AAF525_07035 [Pseudomonadota bacterium]